MLIQNILQINSNWALNPVKTGLATWISVADISTGLFRKFGSLLAPSTQLYYNVSFYVSTYVMSSSGHSYCTEPIRCSTFCCIKTYCYFKWIYYYYYYYYYYYCLLLSYPVVFYCVTNWLLLSHICMLFCSCINRPIFIVRIYLINTSPTTESTIPTILFVFTPIIPTLL
jgi:hypothetical protein